MNQISFEEALSLLRTYHPAVHAEQYLNYRRYGDDESNNRYYLADGCVVVEDCYDFEDEYNGKYTFWAHIHEISDDCDITKVTRTVYERVEAERALHEKFDGCIVIAHVGELSDKLNAYQGFRKFIRMGEQYELDPHIVQLTPDDLPDINRLCDAERLKDDTWFGKREAEGFVNWDFEWAASENDRLIGYRTDDGQLVGIADWRAEDELNLGFLCNLFVAPEFRGRGVGRSIVKTAMANLPDRVWLYQAARDNAPSIALAKSLGYTFEGANLFVYSVN